VLIQYDKARRAEALAEAARLRSSGQNVVTRLLSDREVTEPAAEVPASSGGSSVRSIRDVYEQVITYQAEQGGR